ncbi:L-fucose permease [Fusarium circinatum]|uniref:L-fucose permease n=1 Tax=Fusarium circinatum TaxID=48490 RepID=A0A8H5T5P7_FUSCI|nr:L-fucose permease [Fusarium circinatum]
MAEEVYMMEPPKGQGRWEAGSAATIQIIFGACLFTLGTVVYGLRILTRVRLLKNPLRLDDFLTGASLIACWVFYACTMGMVAQGGCATNFWQVTQSQYESLLKWTIPVNIFYMLSSDLAKISLLFFYLRLSPERTFRIVIYAMISLFGCHPIKASWDLAAQAIGKCVDKFGFFLAASVANVIMDMVILLLPLRIVIPLQIPRRQKMSLLFLFTTGGFVIIVAIYNCVLTVKLFSSPNYTWGLAYELCWMYAELTGCVICASASSLKPLFKRILPNIFSSHGASYSGPSGATGGSNALKSRKQLSRKQADAIELQSGDDSESGRKVADDDEATLWPKPQQSFDNGNHQVLVTAPRKR